jgi:hypothetical protein
LGEYLTVFFACLFACFFFFNPFHLLQLHWFGWHRDRLDFLHGFICFSVIS